ncbi:ATP-binding protein [Salinibacterium sp. NG253]|uniref:ATP-binding protein n=1 Tax=Salinibacterium sp. NG253 TaxID=2792039 RepID=UPI0018CE16EA|nr:ATP-binding protein [Salinibacterium sp. NG253]MBH0116997.1 ATP-binding protein [Salinibacterium sp. NG253]
MSGIVAPKLGGSITVAPDKSIVHAVGRSHSFESAVADLVDNSIDAGAANVLIRFLRSNGVVIGLRVIDDGGGMDATAIDSAMQYAKTRDYGTGDLGHFGIGMKASSMSQADTLRVYSREAGAVPAGRQINRSSPTTVYTIDTEDVVAALAGAQAGFPLDSGTIVEWADPRTFLLDAAPSEREVWFSTASRLLISHLGITFHRLISARRTKITVDEWDLDLNDGGFPIEVVAVDPFGYEVTGNFSFPQQYVYKVDGKSRFASFHVWPAGQATLPGYVLGGKGAEHQGVFVYRHNRLLSDGSWQGLVHPDLKYRFARISLDLDEALESHVTMNPEKRGVELDSTLNQALLAATGNNGLTFSDFLSVASNEYKESKTHALVPTRLAKPDRGFAAGLQAAIAGIVESSGDAAQFIDGDEVDVRWRAMTSDDLLHFDFSSRTIWLNTRYRDVLNNGSGPNDNDDAPLLKTMLLLIYGAHFTGARPGPKEQADQRVWLQLLTAAAHSEERRYRQQTKGQFE